VAEMAWRERATIMRLHFLRASRNSAARDMMKRIILNVVLVLSLIWEAKSPGDSSGHRAWARTWPSPFGVGAFFVADYLKRSKEVTGFILRTQVPLKDRLRSDSLFTFL
jgi:hypothetical protein